VIEVPTATRIRFRDDDSFIRAVVVMRFRFYSQAIVLRTLESTGGNGGAFITPYGVVY
jgi:hypothetical protein